MYQNGEGVTQDLARTAGLFQQACDGGMVEGCYNLGVLYHSGEGVTQDLARAIILYQQGCDGGFAQGCSNLGLLYYNGEGVTQDLARAASLFQQACDGGESVGCSNLGVMYATADSLFDLAVRASEAGEDSTLHSTAEPALQAYRAFEVLDLDAHYHVGLLGLATGDTALARARADTMEAAVPDHLLATILRIDLARLQGDTASVTRLSLDFLDAYDREMATGRAEYQAHTNVVERRRREADDETVPRTRDTTRTTGMSPPTLLVTDSAALDEVPRLLASPPLQYPDSLLESGIEGVLMLEFVIDTTGKAEPSSITVIESPHPAFNDIAKDAVLASVYSPGRTDDVPVAVRVRESLTFRTKPDTKR
jgi:TonB family protein